MPRLDRDTARVLEKQRKNKEWVESEGYRDFKKAVMGKVVEMTSLIRLQSLPGYTADQILSDYGARKMLGSILLQTLSDIEGDANSYESNLKALTGAEEESLYKFLPQKVEDEQQPWQD